MTLSLKTCIWLDHLVCFTHINRRERLSPLAQTLHTLHSKIRFLLQLAASELKWVFFCFFFCCLSFRHFWSMHKFAVRNNTDDFTVLTESLPASYSDANSIYCWSPSALRDHWGRVSYVADENETKTSHDVSVNMHNSAYISMKEHSVRCRSFLAFSSGC